MVIYNGFEKQLARSDTFKRQRDSYSLVTRNAIIGSDILIYVLKAAKSYTVCDMVYINVELRYGKLIAEVYLLGIIPQALYRKSQRKF